MIICSLCAVVLLKKKIMILTFYIQYLLAIVFSTETYRLGPRNNIRYFTTQDFFMWCFVVFCIITVCSCLSSLCRISYYYTNHILLLLQAYSCKSILSVLDFQTNHAAWRDHLKNEVKSCGKNYCLKCLIRIMTYYFKTSLKCYLFISTYFNANVWQRKYCGWYFPFREWESDLSGMSAPPPGLYWETQLCVLRGTVATNPYNATTFNQGFSCYNWAQKVYGVQIMKNLGRWVDTHEHFNI